MLRHAARYNVADMQVLAQSLARLQQPHDCILLQGDLGAGKTSFAKAYIGACCADIDVASPTFTIAQHHTTQTNAALWHYDLYRLDNANDVEETGLPEALEHAITLIEWPDIARHILPDDALHISFAFETNADYRMITLIGNAQWTQRLRPIL